MASRPVVNGQVKRVEGIVAVGIGSRSRTPYPKIPDRRPAWPVHGAALSYFTNEMTNSESLRRNEFIIGLFGVNKRTIYTRVSRR